MNKLNCPKVDVTEMFDNLTAPNLSIDDLMVKLHQMFKEVRSNAMICNYASVMHYLEAHRDLMSELRDKAERDNALKYFYYGLYAQLFNALYLRYLDFDTECDDKV